MILHIADSSGLVVSLHPSVIVLNEFAVTDLKSILPCATDGVGQLLIVGHACLMC